MGNGSCKNRGGLNFTQTKDPTTVSQQNLLLCTAAPAAAATLVVAQVHGGRCHHPFRSLHRRQRGVVTASPLRPLALLAFSETVELSFLQPLLPHTAARAAIRAVKAQRCHSHAVSQMRTEANAATAQPGQKQAMGGSMRYVSRLNVSPCHRTQNHSRSGEVSLRLALSFQYARITWAQSRKRHPP